MAAPHVTGAAALLLQRASRLDAAAGQVGARLDGGAGLGRHGADDGGAGGAAGRRPRSTSPRADDPQLFTDPASLSFGDLNVDARRRETRAAR